MSFPRSLFSLVILLTVVNAVNVSSAYAINLDGFTCGSVPNSGSATYNAQVSCTATVSRPASGRWLQATGSDCTTFCASKGGYNTKSPDGFRCVSGEVRGRSAIGVIDFSPTGCWHSCSEPEGFPDSSSVGSRCYSPGQKRDNDRTDTTLGCFCVVGDAGNNPTGVGLYSSGSATAAGISSTPSGWDQVTRNNLNDKPGRLVDFSGSIGLSKTATIKMVVRVQGACGTSVSLRSELTQAGGVTAKNVSTTIQLPLCTPQCSDGKDNDDDGAIDFPQDVGCQSSQDPDEGDFKAQCQDGLDNDNDGAIDYPKDIGCESTQDNSELNPVTIKVTPIAECVDVKPDGTLQARFGYKNDGNSAVEVPVGETNFFSPGAQDRGQPRTFVVGRVTNAFSVVFPGNETLKWTVGGAIATASAATERCEGTKIGCINTDNTKTLMSLDGISRGQKINIMRMTRRVLTLKPTGSIATRAQGYRKLAEKLYLEQWGEIWTTFPKVSTNCSGCAAVDMSSKISSVDSRSQRLLRVARQSAALLKQARSGGALKKDEQALVTTSTTLADRFKEFSKNLPRFESKCN